MSKPTIIDRKELKTPDWFVRQGRTLMGFVQAHRGRFLPIAITGAVIALAILIYDTYAAKQTQSAWLTYYQAIKLPAEGTERWDELKAGYEKGMRGRAGFLACIALADHQFQLARQAAMKGEDPATAATSAVEWYTKALSSVDLLPSEIQLLLVNRGEAWELQKKWDDAEKDYQAASEKKGEARPIALLNLGRVYEVKKEKDKAIELYEKLAADFGNTEYAKSAKTYLRRLKSPLFGNVNL